MKQFLFAVFLLVGLTAHGQRFVKTFNTIAELRASNPNDVHTNANVLGYYTPNDLGGGNFTYDKSSTATDDSGSALKPTSYNGRWLRNFGQTFVSPRQFGAKGDFNSTAGTGRDDTAAFQAAINYAMASGITFRLDPGLYQTTSTLTVSNGFAGTLDFGNFNSEQAAGTKAPIVYLNALNTHFLTMLDPNRVTVKNLALYIKPQNGWQSGSSSDYLSQPQQNDNAYTIRIVGWGTFSNFENIHSFYGSGMIKNDFDTNLTSRTEAQLFNNMGRNLMCRYGRYALDLVAGSGSSWENLYFLTSSGGYTNQTAVSAIIVRKLMNNETFKRANFEWSSFTGPMLDLTSAEVHFEGLHVEGVNLPYQSNSERWLIDLNGGSFALSHSRIQDVRADWGFVTKQAFFFLRGSPRTRVRIDDSVFTQVNENPDAETYKWVRYIDNSGGAADIQVDQLDEHDVGYWTNSPSWYGFDERRLPATKRFESMVGFGDGLNPFSTYFNGSPPEPTYVVSATNAVGVYRLNSGTTAFNATVLQHQYAGVYVGSGVHRMRCRFRMSSLPTATTDDCIVRIGFMNDLSSAPQNAPTDGAYIQFWYGMGYGDDRIVLATRAASSENKTVLFPASYTIADRWFDSEIIINNDGQQVRAYGRPRDTTYDANLTATIPSPTTLLRPQVQIVKRGSSPVTNVQLDLDYIEVLSAPNGIY
ncbi:MAG: hypothetical protein E6R03_17260 [Hyphomicrobiaceae bacterium]|nr:MAG: hypothetical protein E6R03_17260 [Hyphomicrobiaceae bacterium]